jgi:hypothetical protein
MDGKETVGVERYGTLFKWLYVDIGSSRLNIHVDVRGRERQEKYWSDVCLAQPEIT